MNFRQAIPEDIPQIQIVRNSVKENQLSKPNLIPDELVEEFITKRGKGFVCEIDKKIVGFSIVDFVENNVWALFLLPKFEGKRIGKKLHQLMLDEYFSKTKETIGFLQKPILEQKSFTKNKAGKTLASTETKLNLK